MFKRFCTWRHGRGFGVHSPLAYELISSVLRDDPNYYGDAEINRLFDTPAKCRQGRIVLRMAARFEPRRVAVGPEVDPAMHRVLQIADSRIVITDSDPDMSLTIDDKTLNISVNPGLTDANTGPLTLQSPNGIRLIIHRQGLSKQTINALF